MLWMWRLIMFGWLFKKKLQKNPKVRKQTLKDVSNGKTVKVEQLRGKEADRQRLREMGFCESATVEKVTESGAMICKVCNTRIVLSERMARNVVVGECPTDATVSESSEGPQKILLSQMKVGQAGIVHDFIEESDACARLEEMGVTPKEKIEVIRYAPLGDPIEIRIRGYALSLRKEEADLILVKLK
jgi:ferrous iron transport protein A